MRTNGTNVCTRIYVIAETLEEEYSHVKFYDMEFDNPESSVIRSLPEVVGFKGTPLTIYYKSGKVVRATARIQTRKQVEAILNEEFSPLIKA